MKKILDTIFGYKLIKKSEYADMEKQIELTTKEREDTKDKKNKMLKAKQERIEQLETLIETKDNLLKKRDTELHGLKKETKYLVEENDRLNTSLEEQRSFYLKEIGNLNLEIENLKEELQQKKRLLSRFEVTKEEIKAYENHHNKVLKKIRKKNVSDGSVEPNND